jgi:hypothetical protein
MKIAVTGHTNIEKAVGLELKYDHGIKYDHVAFELVYDEMLAGLKEFCLEKKVTFEDLTLISGMARGVDEVFAIIAIRNKLKLILSIPASIKWHKDRGYSKDMRAQAIFYDRILNYEGIIEIFEVGKNYREMNFPLVNLARNQQMVDIADGVFQYSAYSSTGTDDCTKRAKVANKFLGNLKKTS